MTAGLVEADNLSRVERRGYPPYPLPVLKLARLATDQRERGKGFGKVLLRHVLEMALKMSRQIGCVGVVTDAKADALRFYGERSFVLIDTADRSPETASMPRQMFLSLRKIEAALDNEAEPERR